jgi:hypothetical protein
MVAQDVFHDVLRSRPNADRRDGCNHVLLVSCMAVYDRPSNCLEKLIVAGVL